MKVKMRRVMKNGTVTDEVIAVSDDGRVEYMDYVPTLLGCLSQLTDTEIISFLNGVEITAEIHEDFFDGWC